MCREGSKYMDESHLAYEWSVSACAAWAGVAVWWWGWFGGRGGPAGGRLDYLKSPWLGRSAMPVKMYTPRGRLAVGIHWRTGTRAPKNRNSWCTLFCW